MFEEKFYLFIKNIPTKFEHRSSTLTPTYVFDKPIHENGLQNGRICLVYKGKWLKRYIKSSEIMVSDQKSVSGAVQDITIPSGCPTDLKIGRDHVYMFLEVYYVQNFEIRFRNTKNPCRWPRTPDFDEIPPT